MLRRFDDSAFALNGQVGFCGWMRTGGNLVDTAAVKYYANSAS
jgi:HK97 family phage major capsid protein